MNDIGVMHEYGTAYSLSSMCYCVMFHLTPILICYLNGYIRCSSASAYKNGTSERGARVYMYSVDVFVYT